MHNESRTETAAELFYRAEHGSNSAVETLLDRGLITVEEADKLRIPMSDRTDQELEIFMESYRRLVDRGARLSPEVIQASVDVRLEFGRRATQAGMR